MQQQKPEADTSKPRSRAAWRPPPPIPAKSEEKPGPAGACSPLTPRAIPESGAARKLTPLKPATPRKTLEQREPAPHSLPEPNQGVGLQHAGSLHQHQQPPRKSLDQREPTPYSKPGPYQGVGPHTSSLPRHQRTHTDMPGSAGICTTCSAEHPTRSRNQTREWGSRHVQLAITSNHRRRAWSSRSLHLTHTRSQTREWGYMKARSAITSNHCGRAWIGGSLHPTHSRSHTREWGNMNAQSANTSNPANVPGAVGACTPHSPGAIPGKGVT